MQQSRFTYVTLQDESNFVRRKRFFELSRHILIWRLTFFFYNLKELSFREQIVKISLRI